MQTPNHGCLNQIGPRELWGSIGRELQGDHGAGVPAHCPVLELHLPNRTTIRSCSSATTAVIACVVTLAREVFVAQCWHRRQPTSSPREHNAALSGSFQSTISGVGKYFGSWPPSRTHKLEHAVTVHTAWGLIGQIPHAYTCVGCLQTHADVCMCYLFIGHDMRHWLSTWRKLFDPLQSTVGFNAPRGPLAAVVERCAKLISGVLYVCVPLCNGLRKTSLGYAAPVLVCARPFCELSR